MDVGLILLDKKGNLVDKINYAKLKSKDEAILHKGDNTQIDFEGDDEKISINLNNIDPNVDTMYIFLSVFSQDEGFEYINSGKVRIVI